MTPRLSKFVLTTHITTSVGWLGAVAGFLVLSIAGVTGHDAEGVRAAYLSMNLIGLYVIVPLGFAAALTGLVQSLGTNWGLFKYYWILMKFLLTIGATYLLLIHQFGAVARAARIASDAAPGMLPDLRRVGSELLAEASFALLVLLAITTLSVYKPWGRTRYGEGKQRELQRLGTETPITFGGPALPDLLNETADKGIPLSLKIFVTITGVLMLMFGALHHSVHGLHHLH